MNLQKSDSQLICRCLARSWHTTPTRVSTAHWKDTSNDMKVTDKFSAARIKIVDGRMERRRPSPFLNSFFSALWSDTIQHTFKSELQLLFQTWTLLTNMTGWGLLTWDSNGTIFLIEVNGCLLSASSAQHFKKKKGLKTGKRKKR